MATALGRRWDPLQDLFQVGNELNRLIGTAESSVKGVWSPAADILEGPKQFQIVVELPGMNSEDVNITVENDVLTLTGERQFSEPEGQDSFRRVEGQ
ncbi:MAG: Hsp20/alpha crystallin family protein [Actinomycetota bacterium]